MTGLTRVPMRKALSLNRGHATAFAFSLITLLLVVACGGESHGGSERLD